MPHGGRLTLCCAFFLGQKKKNREEGTNFLKKRILMFGFNYIKPYILGS